MEQTSIQTYYVELRLDEFVHPLSIGDCRAVHNHISIAPPDILTSHTLYTGEEYEEIPLINTSH